MFRALAPAPLEGENRDAAPAPAGEERDVRLARRVRGRWRSEACRRLTMIRREAPLTDAAIAELLGVSERYVRRLISGERQPSPTVIAKAWLVFRLNGQDWGLAPKGPIGPVTGAAAGPKVPTMSDPKTPQQREDEGRPAGWPDFGPTPQEGQNRPMNPGPGFREIAPGTYEYDVDADPHNVVG